MIVLLIIHQLITYLVTVPGSHSHHDVYLLDTLHCNVLFSGCEQGYQGPGGIHDWSPERNNSGCIGGITGYIDKVFLKSLVSNLFITNFLLQKFFTSDHIYGNPTAKGVYSASAFDPEGLFGTLTSIF